MGLEVDDSMSQTKRQIPPLQMDKAEARQSPQIKQTSELWMTLAQSPYVMRYALRRYGSFDATQIAYLQRTFGNQSLNQTSNRQPIQNEMYVATSTHLMGSIQKNELDTVKETITRGIQIQNPIGNVPSANVANGQANFREDIIAVQKRLRTLELLKDSGKETPVETTQFVPVNSLQKTIRAIKQFQKTRVNFWKKNKKVDGDITSGVITPNDATYQLLTQISTYTEQFPTGERFTFHDYVPSGHTQDTSGTKFSGSGKAKPSNLGAEEYAAMGLSQQQANALRFVSTHEGNFDALNTYDRARVSFGFIQFAGGRGLPPLMALLKLRRPEAFHTMFQVYGIDVEFNLKNTKALSPVITVIEPITQKTLKGDNAESLIRDNKKLSAVFVRAGHNLETQRGQIEAATQNYVIPSLKREVSFSAEVVEVLDPLTDKVKKSYVGRAAREFRLKSEYSSLKKANLIREQKVNTKSNLEKILLSEKGLAMLFDRSIQEGVGTGPKRIEAAIKWVADKRGLKNINDTAKYEQEVMKQVIDDLMVDSNVKHRINKATENLRTLLKKIPLLKNESILTILQQPEINVANEEIKQSIVILVGKSDQINQQETYQTLQSILLALEFPAKPSEVKSIKKQIIFAMGSLIRLSKKLNKRSKNAKAFANRLRNILNSTSLANPQ